jgi:ribonuclease HII
MCSLITIGKGLGRAKLKCTKAVNSYLVFACDATCGDGSLDGVMSAKYWHRLSHECELWRNGITLVAGVDEAGCAPLAGPVVAAAVVFPCAWCESGLYSKLRGLNDSKQLTEEEREKYYARIIGHPEVRYAVVTVDVEAIDRFNIRQAAWRGMHLALDQLDPKPQHALGAGMRINWLPYPHTALVNGDCKSYSIAAASVLAKVTRDRLMPEFDRVYPGYGFAQHKGYPTPQHYAAITQLGACPIHRRSFAPFRPVEVELFDREHEADSVSISETPPSSYPPGSSFQAFPPQASTLASGA